MSTDPRGRALTVSWKSGLRQMLIASFVSLDLFAKMMSVEYLLILEEGKGSHAPPLPVPELAALVAPSVAPTRRDICLVLKLGRSVTE